MISINIDKSVIDSDKFLDMPKTSQLLYFMFLFGADELGVVYNSRTIIRSNGFASDDYKMLLEKKFVQELYDAKGEYCGIDIIDWE